MLDVDRNLFVKLFNDLKPFETINPFEALNLFVSSRRIFSLWFTACFLWCHSLLFVVFASEVKL